VPRRDRRAVRVQSALGAPSRLIVR
jgi:hypothetical protein